MRSKKKMKKYPNTHIEGKFNTKAQLRTYRSSGKKYLSKKKKKKKKKSKFFSAPKKWMINKNFDSKFKTAPKENKKIKKLQKR